jgi:phage shock protein C
LCSKTNLTYAIRYNIVNLLFIQKQDKMILGVCEWLAPKFNLDVTILRIIFVVAILAFGAGVAFYLILWLIKQFS